MIVGFLDQARKKLVKVFQAILDKKRAMNIKANSVETEVKKDMMDLLLGVKDEDGRQLEDEDIVDLLIVFMLAGHESSAHGALWAVIYLSQNPELFRKAKVINLIKSLLILKSYKLCIK
jgi:ent-kaurenoic acid hydroxylase